MIDLPMELVQSPAAAGFSEAAFARFLNERDEPAWLTERRREAFARFQSLSWPKTSDEEWRRTDIRGLRLDDFSPPRGDQSALDSLDQPGALRSSLVGHGAVGLEHRDGGLSRPAEAAPLKGAILLDLAQAAREHPDLVKRHLFNPPVAAGEDLFGALHAAFWTSGTFVYIPRGVELETPLYSVIGLSGGGCDLSHTLVVLEEGARAVVAREMVGLDGDAPALHAGGLEIVVSDRARLEIVDIQNWSQSTWHFSNEHARLGRESALNWTVGGLGSRLAKVNQEVVLDGSGSSARVNGILFTTGRQHLAYSTRQEHRAPHTTSDLLYKGGLKDRSRIVWKGMIRVEKEGQRTDAYQRNDNLILSDRARADSIPGLEIEANDVRCTHGATAGRVDEEMIFYAQARAITRDQAIRLIVQGFFSSVLDRIGVETAREILRDAVASKI